MPKNREKYQMMLNCEIPKGGDKMVHQKKLYRHLTFSPKLLVDLKNNLCVTFIGSTSYNTAANI